VGEINQAWPAREKLAEDLTRSPRATNADPAHPPDERIVVHQRGRQDLPKTHQGEENNAIQLESGPIRYCACDSDRETVERWLWSRTIILSDGTDPSHLLVAGDKLYFRGCDATNDCELYALPLSDLP
jgi:hypothetical protein